METNYLTPDIEDPQTRPFWDGCARGELLVQTCSACGRRRMPPRPMCPHCRSLDADWVACSGRGRIWSFVVAHPPLLPAYTAYAPYNVVVVSLEEDENIRFAGSLVVAPDGAPNEIPGESIRIGEPVHVVFASVEDAVLPRWVRAS